MRREDIFVNLFPRFVITPTSRSFSPNKNYLPDPDDLSLYENDTVVKKGRVGRRDDSYI